MRKPSHPARTTLLASLTLLCGCASIHADHFYALQPLPASAEAAHGAFTTQVSLRITVPSMVDRNEMVVKLTDSVRVLEHERWASPLTDQVTTILGQDLERRRTDVLISTRRISQSGAPAYSVSVDIFDLSLRPNGEARIEVRWRVERVGGGTSTVGRNTFTAGGQGTGYERGVHALSQCIAQLAEQILAELPKT